MPLYYEVVFGLTASEAGLALIPLVAVSVLGAWIAGRAMMFTKHYKRAAVGGVSIATFAAIGLALATPLPLWQLPRAAVDDGGGARHGVSGQRGLDPECSAARAGSAPRPAR